jgi:hypothetical protein
MQNFAGYLIAAIFFIGGYGLCSIDWSHWFAKANHQWVCGPKSAWQRPAADRTTAPALFLPAGNLHLDQKTRSQVEEQTDEPAVVGKLRPSLPPC